MESNTPQLVRSTGQCPRDLNLAGTVALYIFTVEATKGRLSYSDNLAWTDFGVECK